MVLSHYDVRHAIPISATTQTQSRAEIRGLKEAASNSDHCLCTKNAIHVVDRAFIDGSFWDQCLRRHGGTVITRMKATLNYTVIHDREITACLENEGVLFDRQVNLHSAKGIWRLIGFRTPEGEVYEYLTNDLALLPGVVAFLYHRRWDKEKYYDSFKNDLAGTKAWGKSPQAIEQQALMGIVTVILTRLFLLRRQADLGRTTPDSTQQPKHRAKREAHQADTGITLRSTWTHLSKITRQVWRFLRNCYSCLHEPTLYQRQLAPMLRQYL